MTETELWTNLGLNIIGGVIAGLISGWVVTRYYRKKDNIVEFKEFCKGFSMILESEIEQLKSGHGNVETLAILIQNLKNSNPSGQQKEILLMAEELFLEINNYLQQPNKEHDEMKGILDKAEVLNTRVLGIWQDKTWEDVIIQ